MDFEQKVSDVLVAIVHALKPFILMFILPENGCEYTVPVVVS